MFNLTTLWQENPKTPTTIQGCPRIMPIKVKEKSQTVLPGARLQFYLDCLFLPINNGTFGIAFSDPDSGLPLNIIQ